MFSYSIVFKNLLLTITLSLFVLCLVLSAQVDNAHADCSCATGGGINVIGLEAIATTCPPDPPSDSHSFYYITNNINCSGDPGNIIYVAPWGGENYTPAYLQNLWVGVGYRVLRNPSGSHMIMVSPDYTGTVAGVNMNGLPADVYEAIPPEALDQYCTTVTPSPTDSDSDGFPDCLDPCPEDETNGCEQCDQNYQDLISQCKSESNILYWDNVNCTGRCSQQSNFGDCPGQ